MRPGSSVRTHSHQSADGVIPLENSAAFEAVLAEAGYDAEMDKIAALATASRTGALLPAQSGPTREPYQPLPGSVSQ